MAVLKVTASLFLRLWDTVILPYPPEFMQKSWNFIGPKLKQDFSLEVM